MSADDTVVRHRRNVFRTVVVVLLSRGEQRVQSLDVCLEHFGKVHHTLSRTVQTTAVRVSVWVVLRALQPLI